MERNKNLQKSSLLIYEKINYNVSQVNKDNHHIANAFIDEKEQNLIQEHDTPRKIKLKRQIRQLEFKHNENKKKN